MRNPSAAHTWQFASHEHGVFMRSVVDQRFNVFSESRHRDVAKHLSLIGELSLPNEQLRALASPRQGVCLIYPTLPTGFVGTREQRSGEVTLGLSLMFPKNSIRQQINFRVKDDSKNAPAFVSAESPDG